MTVRLWVDDERQPPEGWTWVTSSSQAISVLESEEVVEMSLDYCLKGMDTGDEVLFWLSEHREHWPTGPVHAHSSNPSACALLERMVSDFAPAPPIASENG